MSFHTFDCEIDGDLHFFQMRRFISKYVCYGVFGFIGTLKSVNTSLKWLSNRWYFVYFSWISLRQIIRSEQILEIQYALEFQYAYWKSCYGYEPPSPIVAPFRTLPWDENSSTSHNCPATGPEKVYQLCILQLRHLLVKSSKFCCGCRHFSSHLLCQQIVFRCVCRHFSSHLLNSLTFAVSASYYMYCRVSRQVIDI